MSEVPKSSRRTLIILTALFFVPLASSFLLYYGIGWRPSAGAIHGELLQPIRQMPPGAEKLLGKWALVYVGNGKCDVDCRQALVFGRQTWMALGKEMDRVNRAFLSTGECCDLAYIDKEHAGLKVYDVSEPDVYDQLIGVLPQDDLRHWLFVIDPLGNIVMRFDARKDAPREQRGFLDDLKKLLKLSHIG